MKIFNWMQSKLTGKPLIKKPNLKFDDDHKLKKPPKEDQPISEWPHGLLTIGTLGSNHEPKEDLHATPPPSPRDLLHDFTPEEATHIQNELNSFFNEHVDQSSSSAAEFGKFHRQSSLKLTERTSSNAAESDEPKEHFTSRFQRSASVVFSRGKDVNCLENTNTAIGKKSLSFLLKKIFFCRSGFAPPVAAPALRNPIPESRMEKLMRAILHKKIYPQQSSNSTVLSKKNYLESRHITKYAVTVSEEKPHHKGDDSESDDDGSKWDKTDSEYIVVEI